MRLRGTKRKTRERDVPIVTDWQRTLLAYALEHARGNQPVLFKKSPTVPLGGAVRGAARRPRPLHAERPAAHLLHLAARRRGEPGHDRADDGAQGHPDAAADLR